MSLSLATKGRVVNSGKSYMTLGVIHTFSSIVKTVTAVLDSILVKGKSIVTSIDAILRVTLREAYLQFASSAKDDIIRFASREFNLESQQHTFTISSNENLESEADTSSDTLRFSSRIINKQLKTDT